MSEVKVKRVVGLSGTDSDPVDIPYLKPQLAQAWVNFDGTNTPSIRASYNVSSLVDDGVGLWSVNFVTPMQHGYAAVCSSSNYETSTLPQTLSRLQIRTTSSNTAGDSAIVTAAVFSN